MCFVRGYLHWSALDNFGWGHWAPTFGLIAVDRETFERSPKPSLAWLGDVARKAAPWRRVPEDGCGLCEAAEKEASRHGGRDRLGRSASRHRANVCTYLWITCGLRAARTAPAVLQ
jgi:hypothetical protein